MVSVFNDAGQGLYTFSRTFLVHCPRCDMCATISRVHADDIVPVRLVCPQCGYNKLYSRPQWIEGDVPADPFFQLPLWLQAPCCSHTLWAYNHEHLRFLEDFVAAAIRTTPPYKTLINALPAWIKSAKHREDIVRCIQRLNEK